VIDRIVAELPTREAAGLLPLARSPQDLRGFGPVKRAAVERLATWCRQEGVAPPAL
jgi:hypothetical protein